MAQGVPGRLRPRIFLTFRHYKGGRSSAKHAGHLYPRRNPWYSLSEAESTSGYMVLSGVPRKKIPSDTTGNRSRAYCILYLIFNDDLSTVDDIGFKDPTAGVVEMIVFRVVTPCRIPMIRSIMLPPSSG